MWLQINGAGKLTGNTYSPLTIAKHVPGGSAWRPDSNLQFWCENVGWVIDPSRESQLTLCQMETLPKWLLNTYVSTHNLCYPESPLKKLLFAETVSSQRAVNKLLLSACSYLTHLQTCSGMLGEHRGSGNVKSVETMGWGAMLSKSVFRTQPGCHQVIQKKQVKYFLHWTTVTLLWLSQTAPHCTTDLCCICTNKKSI